MDPTMIPVFVEKLEDKMAKMDYDSPEYNTYRKEIIDVDYEND
jgi:hypothetical protein